jgi:hypothetical protein
MLLVSLWEGLYNARNCGGKGGIHLIRHKANPTSIIVELLGEVAHWLHRSTQCSSSSLMNIFNVLRPYSIHIIHTVYTHSMRHLSHRLQEILLLDIRPPLIPHRLG